MNEAGIIDRIVKSLGKAAKGDAPGLRTGIGDDAAILDFGTGSRWAVSTDAFLEGVHFLRKVHPPSVAGFKALARAVSDLAAVGATPRYFLMNLALPRPATGAWLDGFLRGTAQAARKFGITLIGGDTTSPLRGAGISVNLVVLGEFDLGCEPILRSGARPGDFLFLSGTAGAAQLGLELVRRGLWRKPRWRRLLGKHLRPEPRIELGRWLASKRLATAMIDTSDGLSTDLRNLCAASGTGAMLNGLHLPMVKVPAELARRGFNAQQMALHGGDDYELLFAVSPANLGPVFDRIGEPPLAMIGQIARDKRIFFVGNNNAMILRAGGWDPFR